MSAAGMTNLKQSQRHALLDTRIDGFENCRSRRRQSKAHSLPKRETDTLKNAKERSPV
jgi:hypothetical protein